MRILDDPPRAPDRERPCFLLERAQQAVEDHRRLILEGVPVDEADGLLQVLMGRLLLDLLQELRTYWGRIWR